MNEQSDLPGMIRRMTGRQWLALAVTIVAAALILLFSSRSNYLLFHSVVEVATIVAAFTLFVVAWLSRRISQNGYLSFLGAAMLPVGMLVMIHMLAYTGMGILPGDTSNLTVQLWLASRYLLAAALLLAPLFIRRRVNIPVVFAASTAFAAAVLASVTFFHVFPAAFVPGVGLTPFKIYSEYAIVAALLLSLVFLFRVRGAFEPDIFWLIVSATVSFVAAELLFTAFVDMYALTNVAGLLAALAGFALLVSAITRNVILKPMNLVFEDLRASEERLRRANRLLAMLSRSRQAIADAHEEKDLFEAVCRIVVEEGHYRMARVGMSVEGQTDTVVPVAQWRGTGGDLPRALSEEPPATMEVLATAISTAEPVILRGDQISAATATGDGRKSGDVLTAVTALPFKRDGRPFAALGVYSDDPDAFDADAMRSLRELVDSVQAGLESLSLRNDREDALRALGEERAHLEETVVARTAALEKSVAALSEANLAKSEFLRSMSHELRTPLNSIIGFSDILLRGLAGELNDEQRAQLSMVNRSGRHLLALISQILDLERIDSGNIDLSLSDVDLRELVESVAGPMRMLAEQAGLEFKVRLPEGAPSVHTDEGKVRQILLNLLGNAVKFTEKGSVDLVVRCEPQKEITFSVKDTGIGIPPEEIGMVMEEFHQVPRPNGMKPEGTGLGLSISRRLADSLSGSLTVESTRGKGSTFTLTLPVRCHAPVA